MRAHTTIRLNVHLTDNGDPISWALLRYTTDHRGIPRSDLLLHGALPGPGIDPSDLGSVAWSLLRAVSRNA